MNMSLNYLSLVGFNNCDTNVVAIICAQLLQIMHSVFSIYESMY